VPGVPNNNLMVSFKYEFSKDLLSRIYINHTGEYFANDFNGPAPNVEDKINNYVNDSFTKVDLSSIYVHKFNQLELKLRLKIENIFDERFNQSIVPNAFGNNYFEPSTGRSFYFTISAGI
jgi:outer membrane receptor protein involved in Fe transport